MIVTESVVDAAAVWSAGLRNVLPVYGVNGLTDEIVTHLQECRVKRVALALDSDDAGEYAARSNGQSWDKADQVGLNALKAAGARIVTADAALQAEAKKRSAPIIEEWIKQASAKLPNAKAVLDEFHAELKKVAAERR